MPQVICIGSTAKDVFFPTEEGVFVDTPEDIEAQRKVMFEVDAKYQVEDRYEAPGGVAANGAQGLARLGIKAACYSFIGDDSIADWVTAEVEKEGVDVSRLVRVPDAWTDLSSILVFTQTGERTIFFNRDANEKLVIQPEKLSSTEWFLVSALNGAWEKHIADILALVQENTIHLALNPGQKNLQDNPHRVLEAVKRSEVLLLNKDEAITLVSAIEENETRQGLQDETSLIQTLHGYGANVIGLTDGQRGAWASDGTHLLHAEATVKKAVDVTGCGDAFGSAFLAAWIKYGRIEMALAWGVSNGGNVALYYGAKEGLMKEEAIQEKVKHVTVKQL